MHFIKDFRKEFWKGFPTGILQGILLVNFIKDFGKEIYNGFYEGIPSDDIGEIITVNFDFSPLNIENIQPQKMVSEWL